MQKNNRIIRIFACAAVFLFLLLIVTGLLKAGVRTGRAGKEKKQGEPQSEAVLQTESVPQTDAGTGVSAEAPGVPGSSGAVNPAETASVPEPPVKKWDSPMERYYMDDSFWDGSPPRDVQLLTPNEYSRPQTPISQVNDIVVHYVDEPGSTAQQNRDYFESMKDGSDRSVSSHFVISLDGSIIQCVPLGEVAYASNNRNNDTISIECCHPDESGLFTDETYESCTDLCAWLCYAFEITPDHVIRHYDVNEKYCPIYYVEHPDAWEQMKKDIADKYGKLEKKFGIRRVS